MTRLHYIKMAKHLLNYTAIDKEAISLDGSATKISITHCKNTEMLIILLEHNAFAKNEALLSSFMKKKTQSYQDCRICRNDDVSTFIEIIKLIFKHNNIYYCFLIEVLEHMPLIHELKYAPSYRKNSKIYMEIVDSLLKNPTIKTTNSSGETIVVIMQKHFSYACKKHLNVLLCLEEAILRKIKINHIDLYSIAAKQALKNPSVIIAVKCYVQFVKCCKDVYSKYLKFASDKQFIQ